MRYAIWSIKRKIRHAWLRIGYVLRQLKRKIREMYRWLFIKPLKSPTHGRAGRKVRVITPPRPTIYSPVEILASPAPTRTAHKKVRIVKNTPEVSNTQSKKGDSGKKKKLVVKPVEKRGLKAQLNEIGFFPGPGENNSTFYGVIHSPWGNIDAKVVRRNGRYCELFIRNPPKQAIEGGHQMCFNLRALKDGWHFCHFDDDPRDPVSIKTDPVRQIHTVKNYINSGRR